MHGSDGVVGPSSGESRTPRSRCAFYLFCTPRIGSRIGIGSTLQPYVGIFVLGVFGRKLHISYRSCFIIYTRNIHYVSSAITVVEFMPRKKHRGWKQVYPGFVASAISVPPYAYASLGPCPKSHTCSARVVGSSSTLSFVHCDLTGRRARGALQ